MDAVRHPVAPAHDGVKVHHIDLGALDVDDGGIMLAFAQSEHVAV